MPRGRPKGSKNAPNPLREALAAVNPRGRGYRKVPQEAFHGHKWVSSLKLDAISHACLTIHADRRRVPLAWLIQDLLNLWLAASTDYDQAIFREMLPPNARAARAPERYPGYIESLGFAEAPQPAVPLPPAAYPGPASVPSFHAPPTMPSPIPHVAAPPSQPPEQTLADLARPYQSPLTQGPASYPHPQPGLPHNAALFDPQAHRALAGPPGTGNAAQQATDPHPPDLSQAPLPADVERFIEHYRVNIEDVR